jgi:hypothetical protein
MQLSVSLFTYPDLVRTNILRESPRALNSLCLARDQRADNLAQFAPVDSTLAVELNVYTISDAYLIIEQGLDGVVLTADGRPFGETETFTTRPLPYDLGDLESLAKSLDEEMIVTFDAAWQNYYHWLILTIGKALLCRQYYSHFSKFCFPEYRSISPHTTRPISQSVWRDTMTEYGLDRRPTLLLPDGIYRVAKLGVVALHPRQPASIVYFRQLHAALKPAALNDDAQAARGIIVSRPHDPRLDPAAAAALERFAETRSYQFVQLETLGFRQQAALFANSRAVVGPHGAGLANLVFGRSDLRVFELNRALDQGRSGIGPTAVRPWYYLLAATKGLEYSFADISDPQMTEDVLLEHLLSFDSR